MNLEADKLAQDMLSEAMSKPVEGEGEMEIVSDLRLATRELDQAVYDVVCDLFGEKAITTMGASNTIGMQWTTDHLHRFALAYASRHGRSPTPSPQESALRKGDTGPVVCANCGNDIERCRVATGWYHTQPTRHAKCCGKAAPISDSLTEDSEIGPKSPSLLRDLCGKLEDHSVHSETIRVLTVRSHLELAVEQSEKALASLTQERDALREALKTARRWMTVSPDWSNPKSMQGAKDAIALVDAALTQSKGGV